MAPVGRPIAKHKKTRQTWTLVASERERERYDLKQETQSVFARILCDTIRQRCL
jgi:hypothetical protein